jgi:hypothetical protein
MQYIYTQGKTEQFRVMRIILLLTESPLMSFEFYALVRYYLKCNSLDELDLTLNQKHTLLI